MIATNSPVLTEMLENNALLITINRPDKLNALNRNTIDELHEVLVEAEHNKEVRAIIITGAGEKAFVAGADIAEFANYSVEEGKQMSSQGHFKIFNFLENYSKPTIAAIRGFALGGGLELALACHIRVATDNSKLGFPEVSLGVIPGYGGTQRLAHLVGKGKAFEMILTGEMIDAQDAYKWGLVNYVVSSDNLMPKCMELVKKISIKSPTAIAAAIRAINAGYNPQLNGYEVEIEEFGKSFGTEDFKEGVTAFLEKRKPKFSGN
ncbi:MAG: enoyl-CoA hydratase-related protein [Bacteroidia bacterium]